MSNWHGPGTARKIKKALQTLAWHGGTAGTAKFPVRGATSAFGLRTSAFGLPNLTSAYGYLRVSLRVASQKKPDFIGSSRVHGSAAWYATAPHRAEASQRRRAPPPSPVTLSRTLSLQLQPSTVLLPLPPFLRYLCCLIPFSLRLRLVAFGLNLSPSSEFALRVPFSPFLLCCLRVKIPFFFRVFRRQPRGRFISLSNTC
jgi:hypothetical protein